MFIYKMQFALQLYSWLTICPFDFLRESFHSYVMSLIEMATNLGSYKEKTDQ